MQFNILKNKHQVSLKDFLVIVWLWGRKSTDHHLFRAKTKKINTFMHGISCLYHSFCGSLPTPFCFVSPERELPVNSSEKHNKCSGKGSPATPQREKNHKKINLQTPLDPWIRFSLLIKA